MTLKKWEKEIIQKQIDDEYQTINRLKKSYNFALEDVKKKILELQGREQTQSVIYQIKYQQALQGQLEEIVGKMANNWYDTTSEYLKDCYEDGFYGTMYSLHNQGIPLVMPINQEEIAQIAAQSPITGIVLSNNIYDNAQNLARISREEITRGLATGSSYADIARGIDKRGEASLNGAYRIARTEGHRVHEEVKQKTTARAKDKGADVVKQWDSTIDKRTRPHHTELDGQLREVDTAFKIPSTGATAQYPGAFGIAAEDIHCRCTSLQRARWALDKEEVEKYVGDLNGLTDEQMDGLADKLGVTKDELVKSSNGVIEADGTVNHTIQAKNYNDFKKKYKKKEKIVQAKEAAQAEVQVEQGKNTPFAPEAYEQRKKDAWKNRFKNKDDADKFYRKELDDNWDELTEREKYSVWEYTHNSNPINKSLSGYHDDWGRSDYIGKENTDWGHEDNWRDFDSDEFIKKFGKEGTNHVDYKRVDTDLTKAIDKSEIGKDVYLVRGSDTGGAAGLFEEVIDFDKAQAMMNEGDVEGLKNLLEGETIRNHAFTSTGIATGTGFGGDVKYTIYAPKGTKGIYAEPQSYYGNTIGGETIYEKGMSYSSVGGEAEVILQRGTEYRVTSIDYKNGTWDVQMEVVGQPDYFKYGDEDTFNNGATRHKK